MVRLTASVGFEGELRSGAGRHVVGDKTADDNGFNDVSKRISARMGLGRDSGIPHLRRAELAQKALFDLGGHPKGFGHQHFFYKVTAVTAGYLREILAGRSAASASRRSRCIDAGEPRVVLRIVAVVPRFFLDGRRSQLRRTCIEGGFFVDTLRHST